MSADNAVRLPLGFLGGMLAPIAAAPLPVVQDNDPGDETDSVEEATPSIAAAADAAQRIGVDRAAIETATRAILIAIGEDPDREGIRDTPRRYAKWWAEFIEHDPGKLDTAFETATTDQMVVVTGMKVWTLCEHHLLPFWCRVSIGYIPNGRVIGLSKLARIAHHYAHRLQLQEQLVAQIAAHVAQVTDTSDVAVVAQGEHLCMVSRGIRTEGVMSSSSLLGRFRRSAARNEFLALAGLK